MWLGSKTRIALILISIFILVAIFRIALAFQHAEFSYDAYDTLRQVDAIKSTGLPLFHDPLSYGGRDRLIIPLYYYIMAFFSFVVPKLFLIKVLPNLFAASIVFPVYHLVRHMTEKKSFGIISAFLAGFVPASFLVGVNDGSSITLVVPFLFLTIYLFLKSRKKGKHLHFLLGMLVLLPFMSFLSMILLLAMLFFLIILKLEGLRTQGKSMEVFLFFLFFTGWISHMLLKKAFTAHGSSVVWQNIPAAELSSEFSRITLFEAVSSTGVFPLLLGAIGVYVGLSQTQKKPIMFFTSFLLATLIPLWLKIIPIKLGLYLFSMILVVISGYTLLQLWEHINRTKIYRMNTTIITGIIFLYLLVSLPTIVVLSTSEATPNEADVEVMEWAKRNIDGATIMSTVEEGAFVSYTSGQKNVMDAEYMLIPRVDERYEDTQRVFNAFFKIDAVGNMEKYGATHLFYTSTAQALSNKTRPTYIVDDTQCFRLVKIAEFEDKKARLYELSCSLRGGS